MLTQNLDTAIFPMTPFGICRDNLRTPTIGPFNSDPPHLAYSGPSRTTTSPGKRWLHVAHPHSPTATRRTPTSTQPCPTCLPEWLQPTPPRHLLLSLLVTPNKHALMTRRLKQQRRIMLVLIPVSLLLPQPPALTSPHLHPPTITTHQIL